MEVNLINYTKEPIKVIYTAARTCYSPFSPNEIMAKNWSDMYSLIEKIIKAGHHSVLEHVVFTFGVKGISRACSHQLVRHRIASYSQQSQRYVEPKDFVIPPTIKKEMEQEFNAFINKAWQFYEKLIRNGIPKEDARYVLPNATSTNILITMNFRELMVVCSLRLCNKAQWEIRELFNKIKNRVCEVDSFLCKFLVPRCKNLGYCPEEISCGLA